ncbi:hypothetical protein HMI54_011659 [Coelomomyces lativittatus]|nr:hypothetical protein HMI54_011659 [Coelomomyces lativittatus]
MPTLASSSPFLPSLSNDPLVFGVSLATGFVLGVLTHRYVFAWIHPSLLLGLKEKKKRFITSHASSSNSSTTTTTTTKPAVGSGSYSSLLSETSESILSQDVHPAKTKRQKMHKESYTPLPISQRITCLFCKNSHSRLSSNQKIPFHLRAQVLKDEERSFLSINTSETQKKKYK